MLFAWIDKQGRLGDELAAVARGDLLSPFHLSLLRVGQGVLGCAGSGILPTTVHREGLRHTYAWGESYNLSEMSGLMGSAGTSGSLGFAEVSAALMDRYGPEGLDRVNGQFAMLQWDGAAGRLVAATDRFGILPLRYHEDADRLIVASDGRMILACPNVDNRLDPQAIYDYVAMGVIPSPMTAYRGIHKLPARSILTLDGRHASVRPYCTLGFPEDASGSRGEVSRRVRDSIARAVTRRRATDPPNASVGAFLSGGLDSSTVVGMLASRGDRPVTAFSIGFGEARFDEMDYARLAAKHFGAEHRTYTVTADDTLAAIDEILDQYDEPFGNSSAVAVYCCAKLAAGSGVDTLYAGDGGDEIFAGNPHYLMNRYFEVYHRLPAWLRRGLIEPIVGAWPLGDRIGLVRKARSYIRRANTPNPDRLAGYEFLEMTPPKTVFDEGFLSMVDTGHPMAVRREHFGQAGASSDLSHLLCQDLNLVITDNDLRKVTGMSARAGVRVVYPMLDPEVVALASRIPARWHLRGFRLRAFYKQAMRGFLPAEILAKQKKGFGLPVSVWFRQDARLIARATEAFSNSAAAGLFKEAFLQDLLRSVREDPTNYYGAVVWVIMILLEWLNRFGRRGGAFNWGTAT